MPNRNINKRIVLLGGNAIFINTYSMLFDGVNERINLPGLVAYSNTQPHSYSAWIKSNTFVSLVWVLNNGGVASGTNLVTTAGGKIGFYYSGGDAVIESNTAMVAGNWYHILVVYDGAAGCTFYLNGTADGTPTTGATTWAATNLNPRIGEWQNDAYPFNGNIDEVSVWNKALTSTEVGNIYNAGKPNNLLKNSASSNLVGWWRMGDNATWDGTNWTIPDASVNNNNGTSVNMEEADRVADVP